MDEGVTTFRKKSVQILSIKCMNTHGKLGHSNWIYISSLTNSFILNTHLVSRILPQNIIQKFINISTLVIDIYFKKFKWKLEGPSQRYTETSDSMSNENNYMKLVKGKWYRPYPKHRRQGWTLLISIW